MSDPQWSTVSLLVPFDGSAADVSSSSRALTAFGGATTTSTSPKFGAGCANFPTLTNSYLYTGTYSGIAFQLTAAFTMEGWFYGNTVTGNKGLFAVIDTGAASGLSVSIDTTISPYLLVLDSSRTTLITSSFTVTAGSFHHIALVRDSGINLYLYVDGNLVGSGSYSGIFSSLNNAAYVGFDNYYGWDGRVDEFRISGYQRYSGSTYTVPAAAFGTSSGTDLNWSTVSLLLPFDGSTTDVSSTPKGTLISGSSAYDAVTKVFGSSSILFGNADSYYTSASSSGTSYQVTGVFTLEGWVNTNAGAWNFAGVIPISITDGSGNRLGFNLGSFGGSFGAQYNNSPVFGGSFTISSGTWYHIALQRDSSNNLWVYFNGTLVNTFVTNANAFTTAYVSIGADGIGMYACPGSIDEVRLSGYLRYPTTGSTYTVPTVAFDTTGPSGSGAIVSSGTVTTSGSANVTPLPKINAAGTVTATGSATLGFKVPIVASGSATATGSAGVKLYIAIVSSGAVTATGTASIGPLPNIVATGTATATGTASFVIPPGAINASGGVIATGSAKLALTYSNVTGGMFATTDTINIVFDYPVAINGSMFSYSAAIYGGAIVNGAGFKAAPTITATASNEFSINGGSFNSSFIATIIPTTNAGIIGREFKSTQAINGGSVVSGKGFSTSLLFSADTPTALYVNGAGFSTAFACTGTYSTTVTITGGGFSSAIFKSSVIGGNFGLSLSLYFVDASNFAEAFVMNLQTKAVSRYQNYPFFHIAKIGNAQYGFKADGIYLLQGDYDMTVPVNGTIITADSDFDSYHSKNIPFIYVDDFDTCYVTPIVDEIARSKSKSEFNGRKVQLGRGPRGRYWAFKIENIKHLQGIEYLPEELQRRVK